MQESEDSISENAELSLMGYLMLSIKFDARAVRDSYQSVRRRYRERYRVVTILTLVSFFGPEALRLVRRIETVLEAESNDVKEFIKFLASGFNLVGVAGAIVTQVAVIGVMDDAEYNLSWTVPACYVIGLVSGAFSVYFACVVHPAFTGLDNAVSIKQWLGQPASVYKKNYQTGSSAHPYASAYAVMMILASARLLNIAISSLVVRFGIHLGLIYTSNTATNVARFGMLAVLIAYVCTGIYAFGIYFLPQGLKDLEVRDGRSTNSGAQNQHHTHQPPRASTRSSRGEIARADQQGSRVNDPISIAQRGSSSQSASRVHGLQHLHKNNKHECLLMRQGSAESHDDSTVNVSSPYAPNQQGQDNLDLMLREHIAIQDQCTNVTRRLLDWQQDQSQHQRQM